MKILRNLCAEGKSKNPYDTVCLKTGMIMSWKTPQGIRYCQLKTVHHACKSAHDAVTLLSSLG